MGRLIDADKWIEELKSNFATPNYHPDTGDAFQCMEAEKHNEDIADLIMQIEARKTAFDVDKVVGQLESFINDYEVNLIGDCKDDILSIVKEGAVKNE